jgi:hypothetical protein
MNEIKNRSNFIDNLRYWIGLFWSLSLMRRAGRWFFLNYSHFILRKLRLPEVKAAYFRRSITSTDFVPFWSDIDLTIVIQSVDANNYQSVERFYNNVQKFLPWVCDIEVIEERFLASWANSGGYRKWYAESWIVIWGEKLQAKLYPARVSQRAFDLAWEYRFLYQQLQSFFYQIESGNGGRFSYIGLRKVIADIIFLSRINLFSETLPKTQSREEILESFFSDPFWSFKTSLVPFTDSSDELKRIHIRLHNKILENISVNLSGYLNGYDVSSFYNFNENEPQLANLLLFGKKTYLMKVFDIEKMDDLGRSNRIWIDLETLRIFKAIGVQEHDYIYKFLSESDFDFLEDYMRQRLSQDHYQALLERGSEERLYYCKQNISGFLRQVNIPVEEQLIRGGSELQIAINLIGYLSQNC